MCLLIDSARRPQCLWGSAPRQLQLPGQPQPLEEEAAGARGIQQARDGVFARVGSISSNAWAWLPRWRRRACSIERPLP